MGRLTSRCLVEGYATGNFSAEQASNLTSVVESLLKVRLFPGLTCVRADFLDWQSSSEEHFAHVRHASRCQMQVSGTWTPLLLLLGDSQSQGLVSVALPTRVPSSSQPSVYGMLSCAERKSMQEGVCICRRNCMCGRFFPPNAHRNAFCGWEPARLPCCPSRLRTRRTTTQPLCSHTRCAVCALESRDTFCGFQWQRFIWATHPVCRISAVLHEVSRPCPSRLQASCTEDHRA